MGKVIEHHHTLEFVEILAMDHLKRGLFQKSHPFRNMVVSTIGSEGPESRMVIVRDMAPDPFQIAFHSDYRSSKITSLQQNDAISMLFWHPSSRLQIRLKANAVIHNKNIQAMRSWDQLGENMKAAYNTEKAPGTRLPGNAWVASALHEPTSAQYFSVITARINEMDVLQLSRVGHIRARFLYADGSRKEGHFLTP